MLYYSIGLLSAFHWITLNVSRDYSQRSTGLLFLFQWTVGKVDRKYLLIDLPFNLNVLR